MKYKNENIKTKDRRAERRRGSLPLFVISGAGGRALEIVHDSSCSAAQAFFRFPLLIAQPRVRSFRS